MPEAVSFRHAKLLQDIPRNNVTVDDLARAWASMEGKAHRFDVGKVKAAEGQWDDDGTYQGFVVEMEEIIERAVKYAKERKANQ